MTSCDVMSKNETGNSVLFCRAFNPQRVVSALLVMCLPGKMSAMWWSILIRRILRWFRSFLLLAQEVNGNDSLHLTGKSFVFCRQEFSPGESGIMHFSLHRHFCLQVERNVSFTNHAGKWPEAPSLHINCLELSLVLKVLKHSALLLTD